MGSLTLFLDSSSNKLSHHTRPRGAGLGGIANNKSGFELVNYPNVDRIHVWIKKLTHPLLPSKQLHFRPTRL
jgi:hypothetical protein